MTIRLAKRPLTVRQIEQSLFTETPVSLSKAPVRTAYMRQPRGSDLVSGPGSKGPERDRGRSWLLVSEGRKLSRERHGSRPTERLRLPREHHKIGVKLDTLQPANAQRCKSVLVLQASELALDGGAATVKITPPLCLTRDERVAAVGLHPL